jgi:hypothetical protein
MASFHSGKNKVRYSKYLIGLTLRPLQPSGLEVISGTLPAIALRLFGGLFDQHLRP